MHVTEHSALMFASCLHFHRPGHSKQLDVFANSHNFAYFHVLIFDAFCFRFCFNTFVLMKYPDGSAVRGFSLGATAGKGLGQFLCRCFFLKFLKALRVWCCFHMLFINLILPYSFRSPSTSGETLACLTPAGTVSSHCNIPSTFPVFFGSFSVPPCKFAMLVSLASLAYLEL